MERTANSAEREQQARFTNAHGEGPRVLRQTVEFAYCTSVLYTDPTYELGAKVSVGTVGDSFENALAESVRESLRSTWVAIARCLSKTGGTGEAGRPRSHLCVGLMVH